MTVPGMVSRVNVLDIAPIIQCVRYSSTFPNIFLQRFLLPVLNFYKANFRAATFVLVNPHYLPNRYAVQNVTR